MPPFLKKYHLPLFYGSWLFINLIQARYTGLFDDEAYYWVYSEHLAWGYFDHPPFIALLIKAGYSLSRNELGVRIGVVILNAATIFLIHLLTGRKNNRLFYSIAGSIAVAQIGGIIAVPDTPLLFFTALFFLLYRNFLKKNNFAGALLLGFGMAMLLYSKYHGVLIMLFIFFSNVGLIRNRLAWLSVVLALVLFSPHLLWQFQHGFPSVQYHLFERNAGYYQIGITLEYVGGQLLLAGPLMGWLLLWTSFRCKPESHIERALKFCTVGFYLFFLFSTLRGRVEANWTVPALVGVMVLSHRYLSQHLRLSKWIYLSLPISILLVFCTRIYMMADVTPSPLLSKDEVHGNRVAAKGIEKNSEGLPVVFIDSYQKASKYWFYSGKPALSLNSVRYRRNNYNFWPVEDSLNGKAAFVVGHDDTLFRESLGSEPNTKDRGRVLDHYYSFSRILINHIEVIESGSSEIRIKCRVKTPAYDLDLVSRPEFGSSLFYLALYNTNGDLDNLLASDTKTGDLKKQEDFILLVFRDLPGPGVYRARLAIGSCLPGWPSLNSTVFSLEVR